MNTFVSDENWHKSEWCEDDEEFTRVGQFTSPFIVPRDGRLISPRTNIGLAPGLIVEPNQNGEYLPSDDNSSSLLATEMRDLLYAKTLLVNEHGELHWDTMIRTILQVYPFIVVTVQVLREKNEKTKFGDEKNIENALRKLEMFYSDQDSSHLDFSSQSQFYGLQKNEMVNQEQQNQAIALKEDNYARPIETLVSIFINEKKMIVII